MTAPVAGAAPLDWLLTYEAARSGVYGDQSQAVLDRIIKDNPNYQILLDKGIIKAPDSTHLVTNSESGVSSEVFTSREGSDAIDWSALPAMGPPGYKTPKGTMWESIGGSAGTSDTKGDYGFYNDPIYGTLGLRLQHDPLDWHDYLGYAVAAFAGSVVAAPIAGAIGASAGFEPFATGALRTGISTGLNAAVTGRTPNPLSFLTNLLRPSLSNISSLISSTP